MSTEMTVVFECGYAVAVPLVLADDQTALHHTALIDQMDAMACAQHEGQCTTCPPEPSRQGTMLI